MPIKNFNERSTNKLLNSDSTDPFGRDRSRNHHQLPRHNLMLTHTKCHDQGIDYDKSHPHDDKKYKSDMNGNISEEPMQPPCIQHHDDQFHFHSNPIMQFFPPPPEYESRPSTPTTQYTSDHLLRHASAPPIEVFDDNTTDQVPHGEHAITADHFQKIYGCKTTTNIIVIIIGVILFAVFLILLILLA